jgi:hypothetical protein
MALALVFLAAPSKLGGDHAAQPGSPASGFAETGGQSLHWQSIGEAPPALGSLTETYRLPDVYVAGIEAVSPHQSRYSSFAGSVGKVWKNGKEHYRLPNGLLLSLFDSGGELYVGGWSGWAGKVWKDGKHYADLPPFGDGSNFLHQAADPKYDVFVNNRMGEYNYDIFSNFDDPYRRDTDEPKAAPPAPPLYYTNHTSSNSYDCTRIKDRESRRPNTSLAVSDGDVYLATSYKNEPTGNRTAKVWKNGKEIYSLTDGQHNAYADSIFVSGDDVYVAGTVFGTKKGSVAKVWKNGKEIYSLTDGQHYAYADSIFVSGGNVYVAGIVFSTQKTSSAKVWKNGEELYSFASELKGRAYGDCIFVSGGDVYVAGTEHDKNGKKKIAKVWKNDEELFRSNDCIFNSLYVFGGDVYVAGNFRDETPSKPKAKRTAKVWKNGKELFALTDGKYNADAYAIFVK